MARSEVSLTIRAVAGPGRGPGARIGRGPRRVKGTPGPRQGKPGAKCRRDATLGVPHHPGPEARMTQNGIPSTSWLGAVPQDVFELSWALFGELCRALALRVYREYAPDVVVGLATAGVIPAAVIADILQVEFYSMKISRHADGEVQERPQLLSTAPVQAAGRRV